MEFTGLLSHVCLTENTPRRGHSQFIHGSFAEEPWNPSQLTLSSPLISCPHAENASAVHRSEVGPFTPDFLRIGMYSVYFHHWDTNGCIPCAILPSL